MATKPRANAWLEILLFTVSAVLLYRTRIGVFLFLVPMQIVATRRGWGALGLAAAGFLAANGAIQGVPWLLPGAAGEAPILIAVEAILVTALLGGLVLLNAPVRLLPRTVHKVGAAVVLFGAVAAPVAWWLSSSAAFAQAMNAQFAALASALSDMAGSADVVAASVLSSLLEPGRLAALAGAVILRSVAASCAVLLVFSWWAGQALATRTAVMLGMPPRFRFAEFRLEGAWLWPLIASAALVLADMAWDLGAWALPAWNAALVMLFLYGLQGMAILRFLLEKYRLPRLLWLLAIVAAGSLFASGASAAGLVLALVIPVFGASETWIRYRVPRPPEPTEES
jgi:hypothetical protein